MRRSAKKKLSQSVVPMPYSVGRQTANERGIEGLPQSLSRMHTTWYSPGNSGAINTVPPASGTWERNVLPTSQRAPALGATAAELWKSNPANAMTLPSNLTLADKDGDGTIDVNEFKDLLTATGASGDVAKLFAQIDKDGDGNLTADEIALLQDRNRKFKAAN